jgi:phage protein D/phage baseplate assembly protein gpV
MPNNNQNLYLSKPHLTIGGADAPDDLMKDILEIVVEESLHKPSMFTLKVQNVYLPASKDNESWRNEKYFNIGDPITIGFINSTTEDPNFRNKEEEYRLIEGEITGIEVPFTKTSEAHLLVRGYDAYHRLYRGRFNRSFLNSTDSDIVRRIAGETRIPIGQIDESGVPHEYVFQENQTNIDFLRERAARVGFELFVQDNKLYFRKPKNDSTLKLEWLKDLSSFNVRVTSDAQVSSVKVNGWDYTKKEAISETATKEQVVTATGNGNGSATSQAFKMNPPEMIVVNRPIETPKEAQQIAQSLCDELGGEFVTADAKAEGNPKVRPGRVISLENMGARYTGKYYVTETRHRYSKRVYKTDFTVRGLRGGGIPSTLLSKSRLQPGQTLLVGLVTNNKDPKGLGRVKVKFPTLTDKDESHWARVVGLGAANHRGFYCLPEIDDEVLVGFEHGDIHRPYIVGGVWNGKDKTVEGVDETIQDGKVRLRTIKTRTGHTIQFVEEDQSQSFAGLYIRTTNGHRIELNDSQGFINIQTTGKHTIRMDDRTSTVRIRTRMGQQLTFQDSGLNVTLQTPGRVNINAAQSINLTSPIAINLTAPFITLKGIVTIIGKLIGA